MKITKISAILLISLGLIGGIVGTIAMQTHAANNTTAATNTMATNPTDTTAVNPTTTTTTNPTNTTTTVPTNTDTKTRGHAPLGGDGNITAINGTTITMQEEADEGGASYTVDASNAKIINKGAATDLSTLKVGDKIFVQGTTNGTNVTATSISLGYPGGKCSKSNGTPTSTTQ